jgi:hypothetical protein
MEDFQSCSWGCRKREDSFWNTGTRGNTLKALTGSLVSDLTFCLVCFHATKRTKAPEQEKDIPVKSSLSETLGIRSILDLGLFVQIHTVFIHTKVV